MPRSAQKLPQTMDESATGTSSPIAGSPRVSAPILSEPEAMPVASGLVKIGNATVAEHTKVSRMKLLKVAEVFISNCFPMPNADWTRSDRRRDEGDQRFSVGTDAHPVHRASGVQQRGDENVRANPRRDGQNPQTPAD